MDSRRNSQLKKSWYKLPFVELYLNKPSKEWTDDEKESYGNKEKLRREELREQKIVLLKRKEKVFSTANPIWKVSGAIKDSMAVKGVRSHLYQIADNYIGFYESGQQAFFYEKTEPPL